MDNGLLKYSGQGASFIETDVYRELIGQIGADDEPEAPTPSTAKAVNKTLAAVKASGNASETSSDGESETESDSDDEDENDRKAARKLIEDESRAVGRVSGAVWGLYLGANGGAFYWFLFVGTFLGGKVMDVLETAWLRYVTLQSLALSLLVALTDRVWSGSYEPHAQAPHSLNFYIAIYAIIVISNVSATFTKKCQRPISTHFLGGGGHIPVSYALCWSSASFNHPLQNFAEICLAGPPPFLRYNCLGEIT